MDKVYCCTCAWIDMTWFGEDNNRACKCPHTCKKTKVPDSPIREAHEVPVFRRCVEINANNDCQHYNKR